MGKNTIVEAFNCPNCGAAIPPDSPSCSYCGSAIATRLCAACFGAISIGMNHCPHCGAATADSASGKKGTLKCPRCERILSVSSVGSNSLDTCSECGGLWIEKSVFQSTCTHEEEQEAVLGFGPDCPQVPHIQGPGPQRAYIPCPECGKLMNRKNFSGSGIVLDWCRDHGSWFDRGELQRIVQFIRGGGLKKARERELLKLKEEEDRLRMQQLTLAAQERRLDSYAGGKLEYSLTSDSLTDFLTKMFR